MPTMTRPISKVTSFESSARRCPLVLSRSGPYTPVTATVRPGREIHCARSRPVLLRLLSTATFQPLATAATSSTVGEAVKRMMAPVSLDGRASSKLKEEVGTKLSGSSSRSKPIGASNRPNAAVQRVAVWGVQLTMRLSISVEDTPSWRAVVSCPNT